MTDPHKELNLDDQGHPVGPLIERLREIKDEYRTAMIEDLAPRILAEQEGAVPSIELAELVSKTLSDLSAVLEKAAHEEDIIAMLQTMYFIHEVSDQHLQGMLVAVNMLGINVVEPHTQEGREGGPNPSEN